jgi:Na+-driven multidrug efflux pump
MKRLIVAIISALLFATAAWAICPPILQVVGGEEAASTCSGPTEQLHTRLVSRQWGRHIGVI